MSERKIRVMLVDDSMLIRRILRDQLAETDDIEVVGEAHDGRQAVALLPQLRPDVITLDVQMPNMGGLETLDAILAQQPTPVIMVSTLTRFGAATTLDALERGAIDYVAKPEGGAAAIAALGVDLSRKIRTAHRIDVRRVIEIRRQRKSRRPTAVEPATGAALSEIATTDVADKCIAVGISTGGPPALSSLFETLRPPMPPIVVVQHMPPHFTKAFAWRLNSLSPLTIKEAEEGDLLKADHVYIAPGGLHVQLVRRAGHVKLTLLDQPPVSGHKPSVDVMMNSVAPLFGARCLGVIMTGMGRDGVDGCRAIRAAGGYVLGQDEATSDVYGMNRAAWVEGQVDAQFGLPVAAATITRHVKQLGRPVAESCA